MNTKKIIFFVFSIIGLIQYQYAASDYSPGTVSVQVKINTPESALLSSISAGLKYSLECPGKYGRFSINSISPVDNGLNINVAGPFDGTPNNHCMLPDNTTNNLNNLYFIITDFSITFTYNGIQHSCYINQPFGTGHDFEHNDSDKLQGYQSAVSIPCNGLVSTDTYKIIAGHDEKLFGYNPGDIEINVQ